MFAPQKHRIGFVSGLIGLVEILLVLKMAMVGTVDAAAGKFLLFSDTHYDRYYGTEFAFRHERFDSAVEFPCRERNAPKIGAYGCGSTQNLIRSAIASAARVLPNPDFVLFTGDATRHGTTQVPNVSDTVELSLSLIPQLMQEYFPDTAVLFLPPLDLGNNDFKGDYTLNITSTKPCNIETLDNGTIVFPEATSDWLQTVAAKFNSSFASEQEAATFRCGGYMVRHVTTKLAIVVLNSVLWSRYLSTDYFAKNLTLDDFDPFGQHAWLDRTLAELKEMGKQVYLTGHIPPILQSFQFALARSLVYPQHAKRYYEIIARYQDSVVAGQFFGHVHTNELRHLPLVDYQYPPMLISGSVSPCYQSTPFYSVVKYDESTAYPTDLATYNADLATANDNDTAISFKPMFESLVDYLGLESLTNGEVARLSSRLVLAGSEQTSESDSVWERYWNTWRQGTQQPECNSYCRLQEACIVKCGSRSEFYEGCLTNTNPACSLSDEAYASAKTQSQCLQPVIAWISLAVAVVTVALFSCKGVQQYWRRRGGRMPVPDVDETVTVESESIPENEINGGRPIPDIA